MTQPLIYELLHVKQKFHILRMQYLKTYTFELLENVASPWIPKSHDYESDEYFAYLTLQEDVYDSDTFIWLKGRYYYIGIAKRFFLK